MQKPKEPKMLMMLFSLLNLSILSSTVCHAFVVHRPYASTFSFSSLDAISTKPSNSVLRTMITATTTTTTTLLQSLKSDDLQNDNDNDNDRIDMQDYEAARKAFEESIQLQSSSSSSSKTKTSKSSSSTIPLLTASLERIKEMELNLLYCLEDSDAGIDPLVDVWTQERPGNHAAQKLIAMERNCSPGLVQEEAILREMIQEYCSVDIENNDNDDNNNNNDIATAAARATTWVEPQSRLAVLLFTKGQYEEAAYWCQQVLRIKPWHFEVGQLLVATYLRMGYFGYALQVARHYTLPALNDNTNHKRRREWVEAATDAAQEALQQARKAAILAVSIDPSSEEECPIEATSVTTTTTTTGGKGGDNNICWQ